MFSAHADIVARQKLPGIAGRPGTMFALLDAANLPGLHAQIQTLGAAALCLFKGASAKTLRDVAPYLLRLDGDSAFLAGWLGCDADPAAPRDQFPGILIQADIAPHDLCAHFRRFMRVEATGQHYFFRFWDPPAATAYFDAIADSADRGRWFFPREGGRIEAILVPDPGSDAFRAYRAGPTPALFPWRSRAFRLRPQELAALRSSRAQDGIDQLVVLMSSTFPQLAAQIGQGLFDGMVRRATQRSATFGIHDRANIFRFVAWDLHAQGNFEDVDPGAELGRILAADLDETAKMQALTARIATLAPANSPANQPAAGPS